jgi:1-acyl-sn-glycerol-3-phosphate acyltransferase
MDPQPTSSKTTPWPVDAQTVVNSVCGYGSFAFFCLTLPLFLPIAFLLPGGRRRWIAAAMRFAMRRVFNVTPTVSWRWDGDLEALRSARVVVANHEGMLDILAACALPGTRTLLAKTWVFRAFPLGVAARAAGLYNSDTLTPEDLQEGAALTLPDPRVGIFVFPEGSRSRDGAIHRFRPGAFVLAKHLDAPVIPVVVAGSRLGIRPGSMWIHPTRVHSRVLAPMRPLADESHRQFAARVRAVVETEHHRLLIEMLKQGHLERHRRHRSHGLSPAQRHMIRDEESTGAWRLLLELPLQAGWLMVGCGWSSVPLTVRLLQPGVSIQAVEADPERVAVARHQWVEPQDHLVDELSLLPASSTISAVVVSWPAEHVSRATVLRQVITATVTEVMARVPCETPAGFSAHDGVAPGWVLFRRQVPAVGNPAPADVLTADVR